MKVPWLSALAWDGALPLLVAAAAGFLSVAFPQNDMVEIAAVVLLPMVAALVRASIGVRQLAAICGEAPSIARQLLFSAAIATLLMFEMYSGVLLRVAVPWTFWWPAAALYLVYLALVLCAVRPGPGLPPRAFSG